MTAASDPVVIVSAARGLLRNPTSPRKRGEASQTPNSLEAVTL